MTADHARRAILARDRLRRVEGCRPPEPAPEPEPDPEPPEAARMSTCLAPVWDGPYRMRCSQGTAGVCARHGAHEPHPVDGRPCAPMPDGYCSTHGVYVDPRRHA